MSALFRVFLIVRVLTRRGPASLVGLVAAATVFLMLMYSVVR